MLKLVGVILKFACIYLDCCLSFEI